MVRKALTAFALALLLVQWSAPVACMPPSAPMGSCHQSAGARQAVMSAAQTHTPCAELGMCAVPVTAVADQLTPVIPVPLSRSASALSLAPFAPSDPSTPPAPPPQA